MDHGDKANGRPWDSQQRFRMLEYESDGISGASHSAYRPLLTFPESRADGGSSGSGIMPRYGINAQRYCGHVLGGGADNTHYGPIAVEKNRAAQAMFAGASNEEQGCLDGVSNIGAMFVNGIDIEQYTFDNATWCNGRQMLSR